MKTKLTSILALAGTILSQNASLAANRQKILDYVRQNLSGTSSYDGHDVRYSAIRSSIDSEPVSLDFAVYDKGLTEYLLACEGKSISIIEYWI